jgi:hypothetical protein
MLQNITSTCPNTGILKHELNIVAAQTVNIIKQINKYKKIIASKRIPVYNNTKKAKKREKGAKNGKKHADSHDPRPGTL